MTVSRRIVEVGIVLGVVAILSFCSFVGRTFGIPVLIADTLSTRSVSWQLEGQRAHRRT